MSKLGSELADALVNDDETEFLVIPLHCALVKLGHLYVVMRILSSTVLRACAAKGEGPGCHEKCISTILSSVLLC